MLTNKKMKTSFKQRGSYKRKERDQNLKIRIKFESHPTVSTMMMAALSFPGHCHHCHHQKDFFQHDDNHGEDDDKDGDLDE